MSLPSNHDPQRTNWEWQIDLERFRALFDESSEAIVLLNLEGTILFASQSLERMLGYRLSEYVGQSGFDYVHPDEREEVSQSLRQLVAQPDRPVFFRFRFRHQEGSWRWLKGVGSNHLQDENYRAIILNFRDITAEFEAQENLQERIAFDKALLHYSQKLELAQDYTGLINATQEIVAETLGYQSVWVYLALNADELTLLTSAGEVSQRLAPEFTILNPQEDKFLQAIVEAKGIYVVEDARLDPNTDKEKVALMGNRTLVHVSVNLYERVLGFLGTGTFGDEGPRPPTQEQCEYLVRIADRLAVAISRVQLQDELEQRVRFTILLNNMAHIALEATDLRTMIQQLVERLVDLFRADTSYMTFWDGVRRMPVPVAAYGPQRDTYHLVQPEPDEITLTEVVLQAEHAVVIEDIARTPQISPKLAAKFPNPCVMALPLIAGDQKIGALLLTYAKPRKFQVNQIIQAEQAAAQIALAIAKTQWLNEARQQARVFESLYSTANLLTGQENLTTLLNTIVEHARTLLNAYAGVLYLYRPIPGDLEVMVSTDNAILLGMKLKMGEGLAGRVALSRQPILLDDYHSWEFRSLQYETIPIRATAQVPLLYGGEVIGVLAVHEVGESTHTFSEASLQLLSLFASHAAGAIYTVRLLEEARNRANVFSALYETAQALSKHKDLDPLVEILVENAVKMLSASGGGLYLYDPLHDNLDVRVAAGTSIVVGTRLQMGQGMAGRVAESRQPLMVDDYQNWEFRAPQYEGVPVRAVIEVPLLYQEQLIGVLVVHELGDSPRKFTKADVDVLILLAGQAAGLIYNARLLEVERKRRVEAETLREATSLLTASFDLEQILNTLLAYLQRVVPYDSACVFLRDGTEIKAMATVGHPHAEQLLGQRFSLLEDQLTQEIAQSRQALCLKDALHDPRFHQWGETSYTRGWIGVPLWSRGEMIGVLTVDSRQVGAFTIEETKLAEAFANQAAIALDNTHLLEAERRRRTEAETLQQVAIAITGTLELEGVLELILSQLQEVLPYDSAHISMVENDHLRVVASRGFRFRSLSGILLKIEQLPHIQEVITQRHPVLISDTYLDKRWVIFEEVEHIRCWMGVPLVVKNQVIGILNLDKTTPNFYHVSQTSLAMTFVNQAAIAIDNARLLEAERRRRTEAETLREAASTLGTSLDLDQVLENLLASLQRVVPYDSATVFLREGEFVRAVAAAGLPEPELVINQRFSLEKNLLQPVIYETGQPLILEDAQTTPGFLKWGHTFYIRGWMGIPLWVRGKIIGVLTIDHREPGAYTWVEANLAQSFANQAAAAIENARLYTETLQRQSELASLLSISQTVSSSLELRQVLDQVALSMAHLLQVAWSAISIYNPQTHTLQAEVEYTTPGQFQSEGAGKIYSLYDYPLTVQILAQNEPLIIRANDPNVDEAERKVLEELDVTCALLLPLVAAGRTVGLAELYTDDEARTFSPEEVRLAQALADQAALAIANAQLFVETRQRLSELEAVNRISKVFRTTSGLDEMLDTLVDETISILGIDAGAIWLYNALTQLLHLKAPRGWFKAIKVTELTPDAGIAGLVFRTGEMYISKDFSSDPNKRAEVRVLSPPGWGGLCAPLRVGKDVIGVFFLSAQAPRTFTEQEIHLLETISEITGGAIHRTQLNGMIQHQLHRLLALRAIDSAINASLDLRLILDLLLEHVLSELEVDAACVLLAEPNTYRLQYAAGQGFYTTAFQNVILPFGEGLAGQVAAERTSITIQNLSSQDLYVRSKIAQQEGFIFYSGVPLIAKGQVKGVLEVFHRTFFFAPPDWLDFLDALAAQAAIAIDSAQLLSDLQRSNFEITQAYDKTLEGWVRMLDLRDKETEGHTQRVTEKTLALARALNLPEKDLLHIRRGALLHDIGKMAISDRILHKPGPLTSEEWEVMRQHPKIAFDMLSPVPFLRPALDIPYCHHEKWDGTGYPRRLRGPMIPLAARIFSIVDVWDALSHNRSYRAAWPQDKVQAYLQEQSGKQFDPEIVKVFLDLHLDV
ncbi:MAG: GAF domain-containing protein [Anaerolineales bacterium]|nr:GAF domain-containing protein [Anaerolineales bacterium]